MSLKLLHWAPPTPQAPPGASVVLCCLLKVHSVFWDFCFIFESRNIVILLHGCFKIKIKPQPHKLPLSDVWPYHLMLGYIPGQPDYASRWSQPSIPCSQRGGEGQGLTKLPTSIPMPGWRLPAEFESQLHHYGLCGCCLLFSRQVVFASLRPKNCSMPGFPILHYPPECAQILPLPSNSCPLSR